MDDILVQIGNRILTRRKQLHMTQEELAEKSEVTSQMISTAELGKKAMRPQNIIKISAVLGISTDYLLLGKIGHSDLDIISSKISKLPSEEFHYLESIIDNFIAAVYLNK